MLATHELAPCASTPVAIVPHLIGRVLQKGGTQRRLTRTSTVSIVAPATSASRCFNVVSKNLSCVAHAGSSTSTTSLVPSSFIGETCSATASPTASTQRPKTLPICRAVCESGGADVFADAGSGRNDRTTESRLSPKGTGSRLTTSPCPLRFAGPHRGALLPATHRPSSTRPDLAVDDAAVLRTAADPTR